MLGLTYLEKWVLGVVPWTLKVVLLCFGARFFKILKVVQGHIGSILGGSS